MATSTVPAAVDALYAILLASPALSGVTVLDGPLGKNDMSNPDLLVIGWQPDSEDAVHLEQDFNAAGARTRDEDFSILCWAESWTGDRNMSARRSRVFDLFAIVEQAIRASDASPEAPTLNGTVLWAHLTSGTLRQSSSEQGTRAGLAFTVTCRSRI
jgi:hypothetical protein